MTNLHDAVIDSRDIIKRIEELEELTAGEASYEQIKIWCHEYDLLTSFAQEASQYSIDWEHGETLIHADYFTDYCMVILKDCGDLPTNIPWYVVIDEEATAENLKSDYVELNLYDQIYYMRAS